MLLSYAFAIAVPLFFLYMIWALEIYAASRMTQIILAFIWGMGAFFVAFVIQNMLIDRALLTYAEVTLFSAPILEEVLKSLLLIWLMQRLAINYPVEGIAYGFAIGTGFAIAENLFYVTTTEQAILSQTLLRVFSVSLLHAFLTGIVGALAGASAYHGLRSRVHRLGFAITIAIIIHGAYNAVAYSLNGYMLMIVSILIGFSGTALLVVVMRYSLHTEQGAIKRVLHHTLSAGELNAALKPQQLAEILSENVEFIGERRMEILQNYVSLQAQRGILQKVMMLNQRPRFTAILAHDLQNVEHKLDLLRGDMGLYNWAWLRQVLPSDESEIWTQLDIELQTDQSILELIQKLNERQTVVDDTMLNERLNTLSESNLFGDLNIEDMTDIALMLHEVEYLPGDVVAAQGDVQDNLYLVASGALIDSIQDEDGTETIITTYVERDYFGELSMIDLKPYAATVMSMDFVRLYVLSRSDFVTLVYAKPEIGMIMMRKLVAELRQRTALVSWIRRTEGFSPAQISGEIVDLA